MRDLANIDGMGHDLRKLPVWAQEYVNRQHRDIGRLTAELAVVDAGESDVAIRTFDHGGADVSLPPHSTIAFRFGDPEDRHEIEARVEGAHLLLTSGFYIAVGPWVGCNQLRVYDLEELPS